MLDRTVVSDYGVGPDSAMVEQAWPGWDDFLLDFSKYIGLTKKDGTASKKAFRASHKIK